MSSVLFSVCLILSITLISTTTPTPPVYSTPQNYAETGVSGTAPTVVSTSSTQPNTITTEASSSLSQGSTINTTLYPSPTQENSTDMTPTPLPMTTDVNQTTEWTTTKHTATSQTQLTPLLSSTSVATSQSAQTSVTAMSVSIPTESINTTATVKTQGPLGLSPSEASLTIFFGVILGLTVLTIAGYSIHRCKQKKSQYIHQPLYNSSETVDRFPPPDDTLVISGGLYYGPENSAAEDMGLHSDAPPFAPRATRFRLEFLTEDQQKPTLQSFQPFDAGD